MEDGMKHIAIVLLTIMVVVSASWGQYLQQFSGMGGIDWTNQVVRATGIGAPNPNFPPSAQRSSAVEAAKVVALRNILQLVKGVYVNSTTTIENAMVKSDLIRTRVEGVVRNFKITDIRYMSTGDVEVDVEVPLSAFYEIFLTFPEGTATQAPRYCPLCGQPWPAGKPFPKEYEYLLQGGNAAGAAPTQPRMHTPPAGNQAFTGLIVDARGLGVKPALAPRILDENGNVVYGTQNVSREYALQIGVVGYEKDVNRARQNERVANNPLIVKAIRVEGPNRTDVVIRNADADRIRQLAQRLKFLEECRVMMVLD